ncbi:MAG: hypothetical protein K2X49_16000 [Acetobacteraceae bacterium]|nr:hypothetical protein [Acetobacteraceae bacterium]
MQTSAYGNGPEAGAAGRDGFPVFGNGDAMPRLATAWMQQMTQFLSARLQADAETLRALGCCTTMSDLARVQQQWLNEAGQHYSDAGLRFVTLAMGMAGTEAERAGEARTAAAPDAPLHRGTRPVASASAPEAAASPASPDTGARRPAAAKIAPQAMPTMERAPGNA